MAIPTINKPAKKRAISLQTFGEKAMREYGSTTLKDRAIPSLFDGLKPVQRRILWTMHKSNLRPDAKPQKCARVAANVMGQYHPHGSEAIEQAMAKMVNCPTPWIDGVDSAWGTISARAGASRYIECRLSRWSNDTYFDPKYANCIQKVPNYDGQTEEPLFLPAKTMAILVNGSVGISVGATTDIPSFTVDSVNALLRKALASKKPLSSKIFANTLKFDLTYGGEFIDSPENKKQFLSLIETGQGRIRFAPKYSIKGRVATIHEIPKPMHSGKDEEKIAAHPDVAFTSDTSTLENRVRYEVELKKSVSLANVEDTFADVLKPLFNARSYRLSYLKEAKEIEFFETSMKTMVYDWIEWRKVLEKASVQDLIARIKQDRAKLRLQKYILENRNVIDKCRDKTNPKLYLTKHLDISDEEAEFILGMTVRQLSRLLLKNLDKEIGMLNEKIRHLKQDAHELGKRIARTLD